jgi:nucleoside-diphosphate-sugar epimerase
MFTAVITGVAGFIGSHLADKFIKEGFNVIGIDNFLTGNRENISSLLKNDNFEFIEHDIINSLEIDKDVDIVLHFACPASPEDYLEFPIETLKVDSFGTHNTLEISKEKNARYIFASTSEIYGDPLIHPQKESYWGNVNSVGLRSVYDESKRFSESLTMAYFRKNKTDIRIVRIFNTYGPRMKLNDGRVVPNFISQALKNEDLTVYGDGTQTRSFCYVDDLIEGIFKISTTEGLNGEIMNLGNPDEYTIFDFAKIIIQKTGSNSEISFEDLPEDDPKVRCPDISKVQSLIEWEPEIELNEGLQKTIEFLKSKIENS